MSKNAYGMHSVTAQIGGQEITISTGDIAKQAEYYKELQKKLVEMQSDVYLMTQNVQHAMDKCLTGFNAVPMQSFDYDFTRYSWTCK